MATENPLPTFDHRQCDMAVLILGAGFSRPWDAPLMSEFIQRAAFHYLNHKAAGQPIGHHHGHLLNFRKECREASWLFNRDWDNIEELYTQADLLRLAYAPGRRRVAGDITAETLCEHIAWAIWDVYRICKVDQPPPLGAVLNGIKTRKAKELKPAIITTNYDVLCETGLNADLPRNAPPHRCFYPGFDDQNLEPGRQGFKRQDDSQDCMAGVDQGFVPIVKLHGSVNWFEASTEGTGEKKWLAFEYFGAETQSRQPYGINKPNFALYEMNLQLREAGFSQTVVPAIIPPMLGKAAVHPTVAAQWRAAIEILQRAKTIDIIGYSFPETDIFMLRLLSEGLRQNQGLDEITIVNRDPLSPEWRAKLQRFFNRVALEKTIWYLECDSRTFVRALAKESGESERKKRVRAL